jgi:hypothetical protein
MRHSPASVRVALALLTLDALLWFGFGVVVACGGIASINHPPVLRWGMAGLALASAASLAAIALLLSRRSRPAFFVAISLLTIIVVLSITDQVGLVDLAALAVSAAPLVLLLKDRAWYLRRADAPGGATMDNRADYRQDPP